MRHGRRRNRGGFTLLELMLVMTILVVLVSFGTVAVLNFQGSANIKTAQTQIGMFSTGCTAFKMDLQYFPNTLNELLVRPANDNNKWNGPYLQNLATIPPDPWGSQYSYQPDEVNNRVLITSPGPDRTVGTPDDVSNQLR